MIIGFTGTRKGMSQPQLLSLMRWLLNNAEEVGDAHHGGCVGADTEFHCMVQFMTRVYVHPGDATQQQQVWQADVVYKPKPYLERNKTIVDSADTLLAAPSGMKEELRSGTWATVRYARRKNLPIVIFWPDGAASFERIEPT